MYLQVKDITSYFEFLFASTVIANKRSYATGKNENEKKSLKFLKNKK